MVQFHMLQLDSYLCNNIHLRAPVGHGYTQIVSKMGFTYGKLQIESETYSLAMTDPGVINIILFYVQEARKDRIFLHYTIHALTKSISCADGIVTGSEQSNFLDNMSLTELRCLCEEVSTFPSMPLPEEIGSVGYTVK